MRHIYHWDGTGYPSFSKLVNDCLTECPTEIFVFASDRVRPTSEDVYKMMNLIGQGYGLVAMYRFAFFGFCKELIRQVGYFDERYVGGGYEDADFWLRVWRRDIAIYESEEVEYKPGPSRWTGDLPPEPIQQYGQNTPPLFRHPARDFHYRKWRIEPPIITRLMEDEHIRPIARLGPGHLWGFLPFRKSKLLVKGPAQTALEGTWEYRDESAG
jgi:hypothetical protein